MPKKFYKICTCYHSIGIRNNRLTVGKNPPVTHLNWKMISSLKIKILQRKRDEILSLSLSTFFPLFLYICVCVCVCVSVSLCLSLSLFSSLCLFFNINLPSLPLSFSLLSSPHFAFSSILICPMSVCLSLPL